MSKSRDAFRTISEVSDELDTPAHVLRFWESKFSQVKPVKRAGGRRYYRPNDLNLLAGIKQLLHDDGMTIKGAQKLMREKGVKHVAAIGAASLLAPADTAADENMVNGSVQDAAPIKEDPPVKADDTVIETTTADPAQDTSDTDTFENSDSAGEVEITNVVTLPAATPQDTPPKTGPSLTLDIAPKMAETPTATPPAAETPTPEPEPQTAAKAALANVPADPSDSDSKADARLFHLLRQTPPDALAAQAGQIAPLLGRMRALRNRITLR